MKITVLGGGVGCARFLIGLRAWARDSHASHELTAIVNTADDMWLAGLRIAPDLDTVLYALAGVNDRERGWGRAGDSERVSAELHEWGVGWPWFTLGDLDLGTHIARTAWLREGLPLHEVVDRLSRRWPLGVRLLPSTDAEVETRVVTASGTMHFQEWWTRHRASLPVLAFEQPGAAEAQAAPGVLEAISGADVVVLAPSNPVVSIGPVLAIPGIREAIVGTTAATVGVSPIIGGAVVRGMADACLTAVGVETSALAVGLLHGARARGGSGVGDSGVGDSASGLLDAWLVDEVDASALPELRAAGLEAGAVPLWMRDEATSAAIAAAALELVGARG